MGGVSKTTIASLSRKGGRKEHALPRQNPLGGKLPILPVVPKCRTFFSLNAAENHRLLWRYPVPARGAGRPSRNVGRGERWARRVTRRVILRARRSRVVLTPGLLASSP